MNDTAQRPVADQQSCDVLLELLTVALDAVTRFDDAARAGVVFPAPLRTEVTRRAVHLEVALSRLRRTFRELT